MLTITEAKLSCRLKALKKLRQHLFNNEVHFSDIQSIDFANICSYLMGCISNYCLIAIILEIFILLCEKFKEEFVLILRENQIYSICNHLRNKNKMMFNEARFEELLSRLQQLTDDVSEDCETIRLFNDIELLYDDAEWQPEMLDKHAIIESEEPTSTDIKHYPLLSTKQYDKVLKK